MWAEEAVRIDKYNLNIHCENSLKFLIKIKKDLLDFAMLRKFLITQTEIICFI